MSPQGVRRPPSDLHCLDPVLCSDPRGCHARIERAEVKRSSALHPSALRRSVLLQFALCVRPVAWNGARTGSA